MKLLAKRVTALLIIWISKIALIRSFEVEETICNDQAWQNMPAMDEFQKYEEMQRYLDSMSSRRIEVISNPTMDSYISAYNLQHEKYQHFEEEQSNNAHFIMKRSPAKLSPPKIFKFEISDAKESDEAHKKIVRHFREREMRQLELESHSTTTNKPPSVGTGKQSVRKIRSRGLKRIKRKAETNFRDVPVLINSSLAQKRSDNLNADINDSRSIATFSQQTPPSRKIKRMSKMPHDVQKFITKVLRDDKQSNAGIPKFGDKQIYVGSLNKANNLLQQSRYGPPAPNKIKFVFIPLTGVHNSGRLQYFYPSDIGHNLYDNQALPSVSHLTMPYAFPAQLYGHGVRVTSSKGYQDSYAPDYIKPSATAIDHDGDGDDDSKQKSNVAYGLQEVEAPDLHDSKPSIDSQTVQHNHLDSEIITGNNRYAHAPSKPSTDYMPDYEYATMRPSFDIYPYNNGYFKFVYKSKNPSPPSSSDHNEQINSDKAQTDHQPRVLEYVVAKSAKRPQESRSPILFHPKQIMNKNPRPTIKYGFVPEVKDHTPITEPPSATAEYEEVDHQEQEPQQEQENDHQETTETSSDVGNDDPTVHITPTTSTVSLQHSTYSHSLHPGASSKPSQSQSHSIENSIKNPPTHQFQKKISSPHLSPNYKKLDYDSGFGKVYASKYDFGYRVRDFHTGNDFGHKQNRDIDGITRGSYHILLPDGRVQNVRYHADDTGFHADVSFETGH